MTTANSKRGERRIFFSFFSFFFPQKAPKSFLPFLSSPHTYDMIWYDMIKTCNWTNFLTMYINYVSYVLDKEKKKNMSLFFFVFFFLKKTLIINQDSSHSRIAFCILLNMYLCVLPYCWQIYVMINKLVHIYIYALLVLCMYVQYNTGICLCMYSVCMYV